MTAHGSTEAFIEMAMRYTGDRCLEWPYAKNNRGYGMVRRKRRGVLVHRVVCEREHGPAPAGRTDAAHRCGNPGCVNPRHLRWATRSENMQDRLRHDTHVRGERHPWHKLTDAQATAIHRRAANGETQRALAAEYGVDPALVSRIANKQLRPWLWR